MKFRDAKKSVKRVLYTKEQIDKRISELAKQIDKDYSDKDNVIVIGTLNGGIFLLTDLVRKMKTHVEIDFISVSSYGYATKSSGAVKLNKDLGADINGMHVLIVEDIIDTGLTMEWLINHLLYSRGALSVEVVTLIRRKINSNVSINAKYIGFELNSDVFVVGYGLDAHQKFRTLDFVGEYIS
jgi:hypoxanthine phosphoribosyltransferase